MTAAGAKRKEGMAQKPASVAWRIPPERLIAEMRRLGYKIGQMTIRGAFDRIAEAMEGQRKRIEDLERQLATEREIAASHARKESEA